MPNPLIVAEIQALVCNSYILRAISRIRRFNSTASPLTQISRKHLNAMIQCSAKFWQVLSSNSKRPYVVRAERTDSAITDIEHGTTPNPVAGVIRSIVVAFGG